MELEYEKGKVIILEGTEAKCTIKNHPSQYEDLCDFKVYFYKDKDRWVWNFRESSFDYSGQVFLKKVAKVLKYLNKQ